MSLACELSFDAWPPASVPVRHGVPAPVGAIRINRKGRSAHRQIKVRLDGPPSRRWMKLARFWWLRNRGPIPAGYGVGHVDGDTLNDDPQNYALMTTGDVIACWHLDNPEQSDRQHRRAAAATAQANRQRAAVARSQRWFTERWYAVDPAARVIHCDQATRQRWQIYAAWGCAIDGSPNGKGLGAVLGWAVPVMQAVILASLADGEADGLELWRRMRAIYLQQGWNAPASSRSIQQAITPLLRRSWIRSIRAGRRGRRTYSITPAALAARGPACPIIAVCGSELEAERFAHFTRALTGREGCAA